MKLIESIIKELQKFSTDLVQFGDPISDNRIENFEKNNKLKLPEEFKTFMKITNGLSAYGQELVRFSNEKNASSIEYLYETIKLFLPEQLVPISPDGAGNYYCLDLSKSTGDTCPVAFWQANYKYTKNDQPDIDNNTFLDFIQEWFIDSTLEHYHYNGKRK